MISLFMSDHFLCLFKSVDEKHRKHSAKENVTAIIIVMVCENSIMEINNKCLWFTVKCENDWPANMASKYRNIVAKSGAVTLTHMMQTTDYGTQQIDDNDDRLRKMM